MRQIMKVFDNRGSFTGGVIIFDKYINKHLKNLIFLLTTTVMCYKT